MMKRSIIEISGLDAKKFLQALITNDINIVSHECSIYSLLLSPQGRYLHDFFISLNDNSYIIDIASNCVEDFMNVIKKYILRSDVVIKNITDECSFVYSNHKISLPNILCQYKDPRHIKLGFRSIIKGEYSDLDGDYIQDKYMYTIPDTIDLIYNRSMPQEYGLDKLDGISYNKGCYVGQELISRTKSQGVIRKRIYKVISEDDSLEQCKNGDFIMAGNDVIGVLCSANQNLGIGLIRIEEYAKFLQMNLTINAISVSLLLPDWQNERG